MNIVKIKGNTVAFTAANTVGDSVLVRIYAAATTLVTHTDVGTIIMPADSVVVLEKGATETLSADAEIVCTPVAYKA
jgi:ABC-type sulfate/molybdate transport systems ATPase subunit